MSVAPRVGFVTTSAPWVAAEDADRPLHDAAFAAAGARLEHPAWDDPSVDWSTFDLLVLRSPWDYSDRLVEFRAWLDGVRDLGTLHNPAGVVGWNLDKRYLADLAARGVPVVPTSFAADETQLGAALDGCSLDGRPADEVVVKPTVSAGSRDTGRFARGSSAALALGRSILEAGKTVMVQPAVPSVATVGELAVVLVDGAFAHAYTKGPLLASGGGLLSGDTYEEDLAAAAPPPGFVDAAVAVHDAAVAECAARGALPSRVPLLYARIDLVTLPDGTPAVLEAELFEPYLHLDANPATATLLAQATLARATPRS